MLVAEDNAVNQIVFSEALKQSERDFEIVGDGLEVVQAWQDKRPKVIVMDDYMTKPISPEMLNDKISDWLNNAGLNSETLSDAG